MTSCHARCYLNLVTGPLRIQLLPPAARMASRGKSASKRQRCNLF